jgi:hypothetical protein
VRHFGQKEASEHENLPSTWLKRKFQFRQASRRNARRRPSRVREKSGERPRCCLSLARRGEFSFSCRGRSGANLLASINSLSRESLLPALRRRIIIEEPGRNQPRINHTPTSSAMAITRRSSASSVYIMREIKSSRLFSSLEAKLSRASYRRKAKERHNEASLALVTIASRPRDLIKLDSVPTRGAVAVRGKFSSEPEPTTTTPSESAFNAPHKNCANKLISKAKVLLSPARSLSRRVEIIKFHPRVGKKKFFFLA